MTLSIKDRLFLRESDAKSVSPELRIKPASRIASVSNTQVTLLLFFPKYTSLIRISLEKCRSQQENPLSQNSSVVRQPRIYSSNHLDHNQQRTQQQNQQARTAELCPLETASLGNPCKVE